MNDRELLELAAKAAGYTIHFDDFSCNSRETEYWVDELCDGPGGYWNPLVDDGDAFRLAVKLGLPLMFNAPCVYAGALWEGMQDDRAAATRRAIVRAAAALARKGSAAVLLGTEMSEPKNAGWRDVFDSELPPVGTELILLVRWEDGERISQGEVRSSTTGPYIEDWGADKGGPVKFKLASDLLAEATAGS